MTVTLNISITQKMRDYIDLQVKDGNYVSASDYVRALIRADSARQLDRMLVEGFQSPEAGEFTDTFWKGLEARIPAGKPATDDAA